MSTAKKNSPEQGISPISQEEFLRDFLSLPIMHRGILFVLRTGYLIKQAPLDNLDVKGLCPAVNEEEREAIKEVLGRFFIWNEPYWTNELYDNLLEELQLKLLEKDSLSKKRSNSGKKGAGSRWSNSDKNCQKKNSNLMTSAIHEDGKSIASAINEDGNSIASAINEDGNSIANAINKDGKPMANAIHENGKSIASAINKDGKSMASAIHEDGKSMANAINNDGNSIANAINKGGKPMANAIHENGKSIANAIHENGKSIANAINENGKSIANAINKDGKPMASAIHEDGKSMANAIPNDRSTEFNSLKNNYFSEGRRNADKTGVGRQEEPRACTRAHRSDNPISDINLINKNINKSVSVSESDKRLKIKNLFARENSAWMIGEVLEVLVFFGLDEKALARWRSRSPENQNFILELAASGMSYFDYDTIAQVFARCQAAKDKEGKPLSSAVAFVLKSLQRELTAVSNRKNASRFASESAQPKRFRDIDYMEGIERLNPDGTFVLKRKTQGR